MPKDVFVARATRTPIGDFGGSLLSLSATRLAEIVIESVLHSAGIEKSKVEQVYLGNCFDPVANNIARIASVKAGLPVETPAITISCTCGSGIQAIAAGFNAIREGEAGLVIAGGVESMSNAPFISETNRWGQRLNHSTVYDLVWKAMQEYPIGVGMGLTAENIAERDQISRVEQDKLALRSQERALTAIESGRFRDEITVIEVRDRKGEVFRIATDEHPRSGLSLEKLSKLPPAFKKHGSVTAGNSSGLNDGAAAMLLMDAQALKKYGLQPMAKILGCSSVGVDPDYMGDGPVPATKKVLKKTGTLLADIGLIELNEAFAAQYISCERTLGLDPEMTNVNGSGIALGHPVGSTGCRISVTLLHEMEKRGVELGLSTLCAGGGQGFAVLFEKNS
mgnify:FL=1